MIRIIRITVLMSLFFFCMYLDSYATWNQLSRVMRNCVLGQMPSIRSRSASGDIYSDQEFYYTSFCSTVFNNSINGQQRSVSDGADAPVDLGLRRLHILEDTFSYGAFH